MELTVGFSKLSWFIRGFVLYVVILVVLSVTSGFVHMGSREPTSLEEEGLGNSAYNIIPSQFRYYNYNYTVIVTS